MLICFFFIRCTSFFLSVNCKLPIDRLSLISTYILTFFRTECLFVDSARIPLHTFPRLFHLLKPVNLWQVFYLFLFTFNFLHTLNPSHATELIGYRNLQRKLVGLTVQQPYITILSSMSSFLLIFICVAGK
jgi:hypothetical protein